MIHKHKWVIVKDEIPKLTCVVCGKTKIITINNFIKSYEKIWNS